jgi:pimeloyl-ACP methyl ester carboxylesterase
MKPSRSDFITVRGLRYHIRRWGNDASPKIFMLHGWMDVSASFQFVVDSLARDWQVISPDWRGYGLTDRSGADCYWFPDYLGDLDALLEHYSPNEPVNLLGHSMGANVAAIYAGVRPERVARLINLEGFGLPATKPEQAPARYAKWLAELHEPAGMRLYATQAKVAARLQKTNPRLTDERAAFLAQHWAAQNERGEWEILGDPAHKLTNPVLYRIDEVLACWRAITAPVLWVEASETEALRWMGQKDAARAEIDRRIACIADVRKAMVDGAGHMLHHDQPEAVARLIEDFLPDRFS